MSELHRAFRVLQDDAEKERIKKSRRATSLKASAKQSQTEWRISWADEEAAEAEKQRLQQRRPHRPPPLRGKGSKAGRAAEKRQTRGEAVEAKIAARRAAAR